MNNIARFVISQSLTDNVFYELISAQGKLLLRMGGYISKETCLENIGSIKTQAHMEERYARKVDNAHDYYFELRNEAGNVIGIGSVYKSIITRDRAIAEVQAMAISAVIEEQC